MGYETVAIAKTANKATASGESGYPLIDNGHHSDCIFDVVILTRFVGNWD